MGSLRSGNLAVTLGIWGMPKGYIFQLPVGGGFPQGAIPNCHHIKQFLASVQCGWIFLPLNLPLTYSMKKQYFGISNRQNTISKQNSLFGLIVLCNTRLMGEILDYN